MSNSIALAQKYLPLLDEIYKADSKTAILDTSPINLEFINANTVKIFQIALGKLGAYSRTSGYPAKDITGTWETFALSQDRGAKFVVDAMDEEETINMVVGNTLARFLRAAVIPEVDQYRFAKYASKAKNSANGDVTVGTTDIPDLIAAAQETMGNAEVPVEGRVLFVSEKCYRGLKAKITRYLANENGVNKDVEVFDGMRVIRVPSGRFATAATIGSDGYTQSGYGINFMIVHPSAVAQTIKHEVPKIIAPELNQSADGWIVAYRLYHDAFTFEHGTTQGSNESGMTNGIYLHRTSTALS